jgi:hypothetical protein
MEKRGDFDHDKRGDLSPGMNGPMITVDSVPMAIDRKSFVKGIAIREVFCS